MRRIYFGGILLLLLMLVSGCGSEIELTDGQNELIAQYAANQILQNNSGYEERLITTEDVADSSGDAMTQAEATTQEDAAAQDSSTETAQTTDSQAASTTEETAPVTDVSNLYESLHLDVNYTGYKLARQYTDQNASSLPVEADTGEQLLIVKMNIKNTSDETQKLDMVQQDYTYSLHTDTDTLDPLFTVLEDDFSVYSGSLKAGAQKQVVLLFSIPEQAQEPLGYELEVSNGSSTAQIAIP